MQKGVLIIVQINYKHAHSLLHKRIYCQYYAIILMKKSYLKQTPITYIFFKLSKFCWNPEQNFTNKICHKRPKYQRTFLKTVCNFLVKFVNFIHITCMCILHKQKILLSLRIIHLVRTHNIFYPLINRRTCAYQRVANVCFSENSTCVPNQWSHILLT